MVFCTNEYPAILFRLAKTFNLMSFRKLRGRKSQGVVFKTALITRSRCNPHPGHNVGILHEMLRDDYLRLVT